MSNVDSFMEIVRRADETANVGQRLLDRGEIVVYSSYDLPSNVVIEEHPDGRKFLLIHNEQHELVERKPYQV